MPSTLSENCRREVDLGAGRRGHMYSLPALEAAGFPGVARLPVSLRVVLESLLRNCDGRRVTEQHVRGLAAWRPDATRSGEVPFVVGRVVLNCAAGIPLLGDLAALRGAMKRMGRDAGVVEPRVPLDMVLDHTLTVDYHGSPEALGRNMALEAKRNAERFKFVKWATQAYRGIRLIPPGFGILHQVNLEYLAPGVQARDGALFPDTLVGTDSHTCMIAGLGVVGWGVGGIEAETAALGYPIYLLTPDVVGVEVVGELGAGVTSTDLVLHVTEMLRKAKVVGKFVEFFGAGVANLTVPDRATISNMAPEYGATIGYFPVDAETCRYLRDTGRTPEQVEATERYFRLQQCFGAPQRGDIGYSQVLALDLGAVTPNLAGPKRPQDRVPLAEIKQRFAAALAAPVATGGYGKSTIAPRAAARGRAERTDVRDGDVVIAAITSCTNTSNPGVMLAAGLLAKHAVERGIEARPWVKTSLTPGSRVVSRYLDATGLQPHLDALGFHVAGYSCGTCVGASGPLPAPVEQSIAANDAIACAVLSGNRNFEARIHPLVRAAFLASPPLVVAFALAGRVDIDFAREPLATDAAGKDVYLRDLWPAQAELARLMSAAADPAKFRASYGVDFAAENPHWQAIPGASGEIYPWDAASTYIKEPPFAADPVATASNLCDFHGARALAILGDSITTDHISPIGNILPAAPAGAWLRAHGVEPADFNNYGARRMNHEVMVRGGFANIRLRNLMLPGTEGGVTLHQPGGERMSIFDAAMRYAAENVPLIIVAGEEYGTGSARDWAAKATRLLGVRAVIAASFERIHRSNLIGLGVLPCQLPPGVSAATLALDGSESYDLIGAGGVSSARPLVELVIRRSGGRVEQVPLTLRVDTLPELEFVRNGGMLPHVLRELAASG